MSLLNRLFCAGAVIAAVTATSGVAKAFCGFYVSGADAKLFNNATQVVLMRDGTRTILSMQNSYQGPPENFAMVVPVPVVLQKENVKTLPRELFEKIDRLTAPRLVEYWEQDPCSGWGREREEGKFAQKSSAGPRASRRAAMDDDLGVTVEARFDVGEYDVVILSAKDSGGLETWLKQEKYKIPSGAEPYLRPYVQSGSKFFVAKVDTKRVTFDKGGVAELSPLRFHYDSTTFSLPVRLGLINSQGTQDIIVNILADKRFEPANYPSVTIPTNIDLAEGSKEHFGRFYAALFDRTIEKTPKAVVTEYSWDASTCDPCPGPAMMPQDFAMLGADALPGAAPPTTPQVTVDGSTGRASGGALKLVPQRYLPRVEQCWNAAQGRKPKGGHVDVKLAWGADGKVRDVAIAKNESGDAELAECIKKPFLNGMMPPEDASMTASYVLGMAPVVSYKQWTLTRLHARYSKESLGEDLVFREAKAIVGGRETRDEKGNLEHGASDSSVNNFQGRYVIRHAWVGPIECKEPHRGVWGGPWPEPNGMAHSSMPIAANKTASVPRGGIPLAGFVRTDVPEIGIKAGTGPLPEIPPVADEPVASGSGRGTPGASGAPQVEAPRGCGSCASTSSRAPADLGLLLLAVAIARALKKKTKH